MKTDIAHNDENIARIEQEARDQSGRADDLTAQMEEKRERIEELKNEAARVEAELAALLERANELSKGAGDAASEVEALRGSEVLSLAAAADARAEIAAHKSSLQGMDERKAALHTERESVEAQLAETKKSASENRRALDAAQEDADAIHNIINGHTMKMQGRVEREKAASEKRVSLTMEKNNLDSRIHMLSEMEKEYDGFNKAVKGVMLSAEKNVLHGVHGPVAGLMTVDKRYAVAIEIALGAGLQNIVVDREEDAKSAINFLKQRDGGRATFLPLTAIHGDELNERGLDREYGFVGVASGLVKHDKKYEQIFLSLLGRTVVADDLDCGIAMARKYGNRFRIVTLDGQIINRGGSMTGGSVSRSAGILSRANELKELTAKRESLNEKLAFAERDAEDAKRELTKAQYELEVAKGQQQQADEAVLKLSGDKNHYDVLLASMRERLEDVERELETIERRRSEENEKIVGKEAEVGKHEQDAAAFRTRAEEKLSGQSELLKSSTILGDTITEKKTAIAGAAAEREATEAALRSLETLREQMHGDRQSRETLIAEYRKASDDARARIDEHTAAVDILRGTAEEKRNELSALVNAKLKLEAEQNQSNGNLRERNDTVLKLSNAVSKLEQKKTTTAMEEQQLLDRLWENYELSHSAAQEQRIELESMTKANRRISELKREIGALGAVNVGAIEEFDRVNTRYTYLTTQRDDVEKAKEELLGVIENITGEMTGIFREQFALIRESFQQTFLELFGGGKATLELEDENDVLSCGIEIKVQPPGKALKTITLLSGGEKAFVAIALYFAILKVHPTPFCVMDEIEAALDEPNVIRVASYMRTITEKTQFIVITHRRGTMEAADVLYGVTMQERGVSKVLTINMNDMAKELNIKE